MDLFGFMYISILTFSLALSQTIISTSVVPSSPPSKQECKDLVIHLTCSDIDNICDSDIGQLSCPAFCGFCTPKLTTTENTSHTEKQSTVTYATTTASAVVTNTTTTSTQNTTIQPATASLTTKFSSASDSNSSTSSVAESSQTTHSVPQHTSQSSDGLATSITTTGQQITTTTAIDNAIPTSTTPNEKHTSQTTSTKTPNIQTTNETTLAKTKTTTTTTTTTHIPETVLGTLAKEGCNKSDIVFMIEHLRGDSNRDVDHQADLARYLSMGWIIGNNHARVGVAVYGDHIRTKMTFTQSAGHKDRLLDTLENLAHDEDHAGIARADLTLNWSRRFHFNAYPRAGAKKILVLMVHRLTEEARKNFVAAANYSRARGITTLYVLSSHPNHDDANVLRAGSDHFFQFNSWNEMENSVPRDKHAHNYC